MPDSLSPTQQFLSKYLVDAPAEFARGLFGLDPQATNEIGKPITERSVGTNANLLAQLIGAAKPLAEAGLPLAVPRDLQKLILSGNDTSQYSNEYKKLIDYWSFGHAMSRPQKNLEFANQFRNLSDPSILQNKIRETLQTNTVPLFRGVKTNELEDLNKFYQEGSDPGIRSFSMDPKAAHPFADEKVPFIEDMNNPSLKNRAQNGLIYKINAPVESILGMGIIPAQRELIVDLNRLDPQTRTQILRNKLSNVTK